MAEPRVFAVDENFDFPAKVAARQSERQAARLGDATTAEGKAVASSIGAAPSMTAMLTSVRINAAGEAKMRFSAAKAARAKQEGVPAPASTTTITVNGQRAIVSLPPNFDRSTPVPLILHYHGSGGSADFSEGERPRMEAALRAGYAIAASDFHGNGYGSPNVMDDTRRLIDAVLDFVPTAGIILSGNSMGGIGALNALQRNAVPSVLGVFLLQPVVSLRHRYENGRESDVRAAYGIASNGADYTAKTAGYDPALLEGWAFRGVPFHIRSSREDTSVPPAAHSDVLARILDGYSPVEWTTATGAHNSPSHSDPDIFVNFLNSVAGTLTATAPPIAPSVPSLPVSTGLVSDLTADTLESNAKVASWKPFAGVETSAAAQTTATRQPVTASSQVLGGRQVVRFKQADNQYLRTGDWARMYATPLTVFSVFARGASETGNIFSGNGKGPYAYLSSGSEASHGSTLIHVAQAGGTTPPFRTEVGTNAPGGAYIVAVVFNGATSAMYVNATVPTLTGATNTGGANTGLQGLTLASNASLATPADVDIARVSVYEGAMSQADVGRTMQALASYYGIALTG